MQSKLTRRAILAGAPAVAAVAAFPAIPALAAQDPVAELGRQWLTTRKRWSHWMSVEDHAPKGSQEWAALAMRADLERLAGGVS